MYDVLRKKREADLKGRAELCAGRQAVRALDSGVTV